MYMPVNSTQFFNSHLQKLQVFINKKVLKAK